MSRSTVELDFFRMGKDTSAGSPSLCPKLIDRRRSFRDIQSVISKINPGVLKAVIESGSANQGSMGKPSENGNHPMPSKTSISVPSTPREFQIPFPALPVYPPAFRRVASSENWPETAPLTIFYNGTVAIFDVPRHKAESILKLAEEGGGKTVESTDSKFTVPASGQKRLWETLNGESADLPIARRKSLQRFLQKRRERLTMVSPFACPSNNAVSGPTATCLRD